MTPGNPSDSACAYPPLPAISPDPLIIVSNRGPFEHYRDEGGALARRSAGGGVAVALSSLMTHHNMTWVVGAMTDADREFVSFGERHLRFVGVPEAMYHLFYGVFCNPILWFLQHSIWHLLDGRTDLDKEIVNAWEHGYLPVNQAFAEAVADEVKNTRGAARVMLHDYHLYVAPLFIRDLCPGVLLQHFTHIPWPGPETWSALPPKIVASICEGMLANDSVAFQTQQSKHDFILTCQAYLSGLGVDAAETAIRYRSRTVRTFVNPVSVDVLDLRAQLASPGVGLYRAALTDRAGLATIVRVDRLDPAKNVVGGFQAFSLLLERHPEWVERVRFLSFLVPSRDSILEYRRYRDEVLGLIEDINKRYGNHVWRPISVFYEQDRPQALAGLSLYDVLLTNSLADGMNLVAKEGPILNQRDGVVVLSRGVGAYQELDKAALGVNAEDIEGTADALHVALSMSPEERSERARTLREIITRHDINRWANVQLAAFERKEARAVGRETHPPARSPIAFGGGIARRAAQLAAAMVAVAVLGFGTFAVSTSADALPGDWRYPIKRTVEDVRYTLTLSEGGKKQLELEYARERLSEVQELAERGRPIGEGPLRDMASQMDSLVGRLDDGKLDSNDVQAVQKLAQRQQLVLKDVAPMVKDEAADALTQAKTVSTDALAMASDYAANPPPAKETPLAASPTALPTATGTPGPATATPSTPQITPVPGTVVLVPLPDEYAAGLTWQRATIDGFSVDVPSEASGWRLTLGPDAAVEAPFAVLIEKADRSTKVVIDPSTGDTYWRQLFPDGQSREYKVRSSGAAAWQASEAELVAFYRAGAPVVSHIVGSIKLAAPVTPTPSPTPARTPEASPIATTLPP